MITEKVYAMKTLFFATTLLLAGCGSSFEASSDPSGEGGSGSASPAAITAGHAGVGGNAGVGGTATDGCTPGISLGLPGCQCVNGTEGHPVCDNEGNFGSCAVACGEVAQECKPGTSQACMCGRCNVVGGRKTCDAEGNWAPCGSADCTAFDQTHPDCGGG